MKEQLEQRLQTLRAEFETGQKSLAELESRQASLRETLLRISGAIQVLEEELNDGAQVSPDGAETSPEVEGEAGAL